MSYRFLLFPEQYRAKLDKLVDKHFSNTSSSFRMDYTWRTNSAALRTAFNELLKERPFLGWISSFYPETKLNKLRRACAIQNSQFTSALKTFISDKITEARESERFLYKDLIALHFPSLTKSIAVFAGTAALIASILLLYTNPFELPALWHGALLSILGYVTAFGITEILAPGKYLEFNPLHAEAVRMRLAKSPFSLAYDYLRGPGSEFSASYTFGRVLNFLINPPFWIFATVKLLFTSIFYFADRVDDESRPFSSRGVIKFESWMQRIQVMFTIPLSGLMTMASLPYHVLHWAFYEVPTNFINGTYNNYLPESMVTGPGNDLIPPEQHRAVYGFDRCSRSDAEAIMNDQVTLSK